MRKDAPGGWQAGVRRQRRLKRKGVRCVAAEDVQQAIEARVDRNTNLGRFQRLLRRAGVATEIGFAAPKQITAAVFAFERVRFGQLNGKRATASWLFRCKAMHRGK